MSFERRELTGVYRECRARPLRLDALRLGDAVPEKLVREVAPQEGAEDHRVTRLYDWAIFCLANYSTRHWVREKTYQTPCQLRVRTYAARSSARAQGSGPPKNLRLGTFP